MKKHAIIISLSVLVLITTILLYIFLIRGKASTDSLFIGKDEFLWFDIIMIIIISLLPIAIYVAYRKYDEFEKEHPKLWIFELIFGILLTPIFLVFYIKIFKEDNIAYKKIKQTKITVKE